VPILQLHCLHSVCFLTTESRRCASYAPLFSAVVLFACLQPVLFAQTISRGNLKLETGKDIYEAACIACHGAEGKGSPRSTLGFEPPVTFPDFSDCKGATGERDFDWTATVHEGGLGRGFSPIMPSFAEALSKDEIKKVIAYMRGFCADRRWPRGDLNLPRPLVTEKAFPENETVLTNSFNVTGAPGVSTDIVYERRIGPRNQIDVSVPFGFQHQDTGTWYGGIGDISLGVKRVLFHSTQKDSIFSLQGEISVPTGNKTRGLGTGATLFETFAAYGQLLPRHTFMHLQGGAELPTRTNIVPRAVFWRGAFGKILAQNQGYGRSWTPMVELLADRDLVDRAKTNLDVVPQFQVTLSRRQHIMADVGVRFPANNTAGRGTQLIFYVLWDWFDGSLRDGW
jgi:mono/diheme cytochrome c family protein